MTMEAKALAVLLAMRDLANRGEAIALSADWGANSLTIEITNRGHTHVGDPEATDEQLVNELYGLLLEGRGLSFVEPSSA